MARTIAEIEAAAKALKPGEPIVITAEEATALVQQTRKARQDHSNPPPTVAFLMKKCTSGKARIHGHAVKVEN